MDYIHDLRPYIGHKKIILCAAACVIIKDDMILLQRRSDNNKWGIIGGLLELDETFEEAAHREVEEETGLKVKFDYFLGIYHHFDMKWANEDEAHNICAVYKASVISGEPRIDSESFELRWFKLDELPPIAATDHRLAVEAYIKGIKYPLLNENKKG